MIEIGYAYDVPLFSLVDEQPRRLTYSEFKGIESDANDPLMKCPVTRDFMKNTYLVPFHFYGSLHIDGTNPDGTVRYEESLSNLSHLQIRPKQYNSYLLEANGNGVYFFSDTPDVYMVMQPSPMSNLRTQMRGLMDVYESPRKIHLCWYAKEKETFVFEKDVHNMMVTFVVPNNETVSLVPCSVPDVCNMWSGIEENNRIVRVMNWKKAFNKFAKLRPRNQIERFRLDR